MKNWKLKKMEGAHIVYYNTMKATTVAAEEKITNSVTVR